VDALEREALDVFRLARRLERGIATSRRVEFGRTILEQSYRPCGGRELP
jgi:hypothetical protein